MRRLIALTGLGLVLLVGTAAASAPTTDVRLSNDCQPGPPTCGYVSEYTLATTTPYTDRTLDACSVAHGRQNEPAVEVDPRDTNVVLGSSNDYCGVYNQTSSSGPVAAGPIWLGYYRSQDSGRTFTSSLVPGYPDDKSPYAALSQARTASAGDPEIAWDSHGRVFFGSESSDDPAGTKKTFGDIWVARFRNPSGPTGPTSRDGIEYYGTTVVASGSSAPNLLGKFNDKDALEVDRTGGSCDGNVYLAYARFTGNGTNNIYFSRSTDHGVTFSHPVNLTPNVKNVQDPDIAVTGNGHVYVTYREYASKQAHVTDTLQYVKSTNCGATFGNPTDIVTFTPYDAQDLAGPQPTPAQSRPDDPNFESDAAAASGIARDCGDFADSCQSGYTFFRRVTTPRSTADQSDKASETVYLVWDATKDGTQTPTGTSYGSIEPGTGSQSAAYFLALNGANGRHTTPQLLDNEALGHQTFPDISASNGYLHAMWWDTRNDTCYSPTRPIGNCANGLTVPALDVFATTSTDRGANWTTPVRVTDVTSNGNYEQFDNRAVPFGGDYLWITSNGPWSFGTWTDWRNTAAGADPRETEGSNDAADVAQCRTESGGTFSSDQCPTAGGLDQDIYGDSMP